MLGENDEGGEGDAVEPVAAAFFLDEEDDDLALQLEKSTALSAEESAVVPIPSCPLLFLPNEYSVRRRPSNKASVKLNPHATSAARSPSGRATFLGVAAVICADAAFIRFTLPQTNSSPPLLTAAEKALPQPTATKQCRGRFSRCGTLKLLLSFGPRTPCAASPQPYTQPSSPIARPCLCMDPLQIEVKAATDAAAATAAAPACPLLPPLVSAVGLLPLLMSPLPVAELTVAAAAAAAVVLEAVAAATESVVLGSGIPPALLLL
mmetsp:Transcript_8571/g.13862  ORF Transcript_8571/g.13862 Transcript_8571/m.13862 type:complete len:264 (+) Transcript_8571:1288-2079(+)